MTELLAALLGALLGAVGSYVATRRLERTREAQKRVALASALRMELRHAEYMLRKFADDLDNSSGELRLRVFSRLEPELFLLEPDVLYRVTDFHDRVEEVQVLRKRSGDDKSRARKHRLHVKIVMALRAVAPLNDGLLRSGGIEPPPEPYAEIKNWPQLPSRVFDYGPPEDAHPLYHPPSDA